MNTINNFYNFVITTIQNSDNILEISKKYIYILQNSVFIRIKTKKKKKDLWHEIINRVTEISQIGNNCIIGLVT